MKLVTLFPNHLISIVLGPSVSLEELQTEFLLIIGYDIFYLVKYTLNLIKSTTHLNNEVVVTFN